MTFEVVVVAASRWTTYEDPIAIPAWPVVYPRA
jgi:hypothetical protein